MGFVSSSIDTNASGCLRLCAVLPVQRAPGPRAGWAGQARARGGGGVRRQHRQHAAARTLARGDRRG